MEELTQVGENNGNTGGEIQLFEGQQDIIAFIRVDGDNTATRMAKLFGISKRTIDRKISFLRKNGYIRKETKDNRSPRVVIKES
jgi:predicted HTH transcriptional regulator